MGWKLGEYGNINSKVAKENSFVEVVETQCATVSTGKDKLIRYMTLKDKHIILGITGEYSRIQSRLYHPGIGEKRSRGTSVITPAGKEFITPLTLSTLSSHPVISEFFFQ